MRRLLLLAVVCTLGLATSGTASGGPIEISISPLSFDYGDVLLGSTSTLSLEIESTGDSELVVYLVALLDSPDAHSDHFCGEHAACDFAIRTVTDADGDLLTYSLDPPSGDPAYFYFPVVLTEETHLHFSIEFSPTTLGPEGSYLYVLSNAAAVGTFLPLSGDGVASVPDPGSTLVLLGTSLFALGVLRRRR